MRSMRKEINNLMKDLRIYKDNPLALSQIRKEISGFNMKLMSFSVVPQLLTIIPIIIFFRWLGIILGGILPSEIIPFSIFGWRPGFFAIYIIAAILWSVLLRKFIKVY
jgi:uncharacterized membrane protein (DUF106 family)